MRRKREKSERRMKKREKSAGRDNTREADRQSDQGIEIEGDEEKGTKNTERLKRDTAREHRASCNKTATETSQPQRQPAAQDARL